YGQLVLRGKLIHTQNRDYVLQVLVSLQHSLDAAGRVIVLLSDDFGAQRAGGRGQRVDRGIYPQLGDGAIKNDGSVQVRERGRGGGIGQVISRHVHSLERRDGTFLG